MDLCVWHQWDEDGETWQPSCAGPSFAFDEGGPEDNGFKFFPYCSPPLSEEPWQAEERQANG
jgi:hypothetical protein